jgi:hypothetical protein
MAIVASGNDAYLDTPKPLPDEGGVALTSFIFASNEEVGGTLLMPGCSEWARPLAGADAVEVAALTSATFFAPFSRATALKRLEIGASSLKDISLSVDVAGRGPCEVFLESFETALFLSPRVLLLGALTGVREDLRWAAPFRKGAMMTEDDIRSRGVSECGKGLAEVEMDIGTGCEDPGAVV